MRITKLDGLRGIFSLMIVFYHYYEYLMPAFIYQNFMIRQSMIFVDFFFVLSGYVITYNYNVIGSLNDLGVYIKKRFARLYPLLFFTTSIFLLISIAAIIFVEIYPEYSAIMMNKGLEDPNLLIRLYFDGMLFTNSTPILGTALGLNTPSWSISSEMISYLVFGLTSFYLIGKRKTIFIVVLIIGCMLFLIYDQRFFHDGEYGFLRGLISFNMGYLVWLLSNLKVKLNKNLDLLIPVILVSLLFILNNLPGITKQMFGLATIPLFFGLSIFILLKTDGFLSKLLDTKPFQFLGKISYSVYLNHKIVLVTLPAGLFKVLGISQNTVSELVVLVITILFILIYSHFTYELIEIKGGKYLRKILLRKNPKIPTKEMNKIKLEEPIKDKL